MERSHGTWALFSTFSAETLASASCEGAYQFHTGLERVMRACRLRQPCPATAAVGLKPGEEELKGPKPAQVGADQNGEQITGSLPQSEPCLEPASRGGLRADSTSMKEDGPAAASPSRKAEGSESAQGSPCCGGFPPDSGTALPGEQGEFPCSRTCWVAEGAKKLCRESVEEV